MRKRRGRSDKGRGCAREVLLPFQGDLLQHRRPGPGNGGYLSPERQALNVIRVHHGLSYSQ